MKVNPQIFRGYDLRGLVGTDLSPELSLHLGKAYGTYLKRHNKHSAVVGRDCRETGPVYSQSIIEGLRWAGIDVTDIGMQLVGTFYWSQHYLKVPAGIYVSASHNPPEFNGFKFANDYSETLVSEDLQLLRQMVESEDYEAGERKGVLKENDIKKAYIKDLCQRLPIKKRFKVVVDTSCATAGDTVPELLRQAGLEVVEFNTKVDSSFPLGVADPTEIHIMERLGKEVLESSADIGFTFDTDGDRVGFVDEKGQIIWNDVLLAIFAKDVLVDHPGATIMYNILCSKVVPETIEAFGGKPFMWRVGHSFLKKKNQTVKAAFIGELSGHFFFSKDFYNHDDGAYSSLRMVQALARANEPLSKLVDKLPLYESSPQIHVYCDDDKKIDLINRVAVKLRADYQEAEVIDDERAGDGLRLEMNDAMFVLRYSQNGPYIVVKFEAKTKAGYEKLRKYILTTLKTYPELNWDSKNKINVNIKELDK